MINDAATEFIKDLNANPDRYPDRVVGIVLGAMLDERLADTIKYAIQEDKDLIDKSFRHESNLFGSLGSRTTLGFFLGMFTKKTYRDLVLIAKIRNEFAHNVETHLFDNDPIRNWVDELAIPATYLRINNWHFDPKLLPPLTTRRDTFIRAIGAINISLFLETANPANKLKRVPRF
jgi:hypothetical protein